MLKFVQKQLFLIFILGVFICSFSGFIYFYVSKAEEGIALASFCLSIAEIAVFFILMISLKIGLLNDPYLSKAFRFFVIIEFLIIFGCFILNIIVPIILKDHMEILINKKVEIVIYILFIIIELIHIIIFKYCYSLFIESLLILLNKKTEYSILIVNEKNTISESNIGNNITMSNSYSTDNLNNNTTTGILSENDKNFDNNKQLNKEEEKFRNFNYFNKFHYSVTARKEDIYFK